MTEIGEVYQIANLDINEINTIFARIQERLREAEAIADTVPLAYTQDWEEEYYERL